jgi:hypothetical protein
VIVIFTKFDSLVARHRDILSRQRPRLQDVRLDETAEAKASQEFEARYLKDMQDVTKKYPKRVPYVRVGRMQGLDDGGAEHGQWPDLNSSDYVLITLQAMKRMRRMRKVSLTW